jgi:acid phosphatase
VRRRLAQTHLGPYVRWAETHDSLLILTFDEDNGRHRNQIPTLLIGAMVRPGKTNQRITHSSVLRTLE